MSKHFKHFKDFYINIPSYFVSDEGYKYLEKVNYILKFDRYIIIFRETPLYLKIFIKEEKED